MNKAVFSVAGIFAVAISGLLALPTLKLHLALKGHGINPLRPVIVMLGDSHTEFVNWRLLTDCDGIANDGIGGQTTAQILARTGQVIEQRPKLVILMAGTNDGLQRIPTDVSLRNLGEIKSEIEAAGIAFVSLSPPPLPENRDAIASIAKWASIDLSLDDADLLPDQKHLRASGYAKWRNAISPLVERYCHH